MLLPKKAEKPTLYFIGVTTTHSSIMSLFPLWAEALGQQEVQIKGIDIAIHAEPEVYREWVAFIKHDPLSLGALVTTHKIDLFHAAKDLFDELDSYSSQFEEISSISKNGGAYVAHAKDPISSGLAMEAFIPPQYWARGGQALIMGAGGSALAIAAYLTRSDHGNNIPTKIIITNRSQARLDSAQALLSRIDTPAEFQFCLCPNAADNDAVLSQMPPNSLIVNATGLGKDRPGSPLTDNAVFPRASLVWELNYRGELDFMHQAARQQRERGLHVEDGWIYFIHGWTQVIQEVLHTPIQGELFNQLERIAMKMRVGSKSNH